MGTSWMAIMYLSFTVALVLVLVGLGWHLYRGSGRHEAETAKFNMMDDDN